MVLYSWFQICWAQTWFSTMISCCNWQRNHQPLNWISKTKVHCLQIKIKWLLLFYKFSNFYLLLVIKTILQLTNTLLLLVMSLWPANCVWHVFTASFSWQNSSTWKIIGVNFSSIYFCHHSVLRNHWANLQAHRICIDLVLFTQG